MEVFCSLGNNDSWLEVYKLSKEQWKSEIAAQEQVFRLNSLFFRNVDY